MADQRSEKVRVACHSQRPVWWLLTGGHNTSSTPPGSSWYLGPYLDDPTYTGHLPALSLNTTQFTMNELELTRCLH